MKSKIQKELEGLKRSRAYHQEILEYHKAKIAEIKNTKDPLFAHIFREIEGCYQIIAKFDKEIKELETNNE